jgi:beta-glucosidase
LSNKVLTGTQTLEVKVKVKNTGQRAGDHSVELYTRDLFASITPPGRRLRAYQKVTLAAGETKELTFKINKENLSFINERSMRVTEPGDFDVMIGSLQATFKFVR